MPTESIKESRPALLTITEAARELNVATRTVWRLLGSGILAQVRIGRAVRIKREDLARFIERGGTVEGMKR